MLNQSPFSKSNVYSCLWKEMSKESKVFLEKVEVCFSPSATYQSSGFLSASAMLLSGSQSSGSTLASAQQLRCSIRNTSRTAPADAVYCNIHLQEQTFLTWTIQRKAAGKWSRPTAWRKWMPHLETSATGTLLYTRFYFMWTHAFGQFSLFCPLVLESNSASDPSLAVRYTKPFSATQHKGCSPAVPGCGHCSTSCPGLAHTQVVLLKSQLCLESSSDSKMRVCRSCFPFWSRGLTGKLQFCQIPSHTFNFGRRYRIQLLNTWCGIQIPQCRHPTLHWSTESYPEGGIQLMD